MKIVIFTAHYPYKGAEAYLLDELSIIEKIFDKIIVVTLEKNTNKDMEYIPSNAQIIEVRSNIRLVSRTFRAFKCLFLIRFWREFFYAMHHSKGKRVLHTIKTLFIHEDAIYYLEKSDKQWIDDSEDTLYYSYWLDASATYLSRIKHKVKGVCISRAHGGDCFFDRGYHPYRREQINNLDAIYAISEAGKKDIIEHYMADCPDVAKKVFTARLGLFKLSDKMNDRRIGDEYVIVSCSNVIPLKRLDLIIDSLKLLPNDKKIKWVHFGDGFLMDDIQKMAKTALGSRNNISYEFKGMVDKNNILEYYEQESIDVFVNCSDVEGIPVSAMEAMAYGIPVIARDVGGVSELVDDECGILLPSKITPEQLSIAICQVLDNDQKDMRKKAYNKIRELYDARQNYFEFYKQFLRK